MRTGLALVLGGARSGKSRHGESLVRAAGPAPWTYVATAQAFDAEMEARIAAHRAARGGGWTTVDAPHRLAEAVAAAADRGTPVLVDCLTLWLTNRLLAEADVDAEGEGLAGALADAGRRVPVVAVASEVGLSIVPENALARRFRDAAGLLHQRIAALADRVDLVVAGIPLAVKAS